MENKIKDLRKEKGLTQQELADKIGVSKLTILRWEQGQRDIKTEKAQQLADYFGVPVGYLLGYTDFQTEDEFIEVAKKSNFFGDGELKNKDRIDHFKDYDLFFNVSLLQHYHSEILWIMNNILGAYIEKDKHSSLEKKELELIPYLFNLLESQSFEMTEGKSFLKEILHIIQENHKPT